MMDIGKMRQHPRNGVQQMPDPYAPDRRTIQPFMPGQQGLLASQLNAGFGGGVDQWSGLLDQWTDPMRLQKPFKYGKGPVGGGTKGPADLTKEQMALAQPWIPSMGNFRSPTQEMQFRQLDPAIQEWLRMRWAQGGGK